MNRRSLICCWQKNKQGFILLELLLALVLAGVLLLAVTSFLERSFTSLKVLEQGIRLQEGRRHILVQLEKTLGYDAMQFYIDAAEKLNCRTINGNKKLLLYCEKGVLYQKTTTGDGSGINPLSLEETKVSNWQVKPVSSKKLRLSFTLTSGQRSLDVVQFIDCQNARVQ